MDIILGDIYSNKTSDSTNEEEDTNRKKPHKCNQCNYSSTQAACLRRHFKTHTGEKLNKCNQCEKGIYLGKNR